MQQMDLIYRLFNMACNRVLKYRNDIHELSHEIEIMYTYIISNFFNTAWNFNRKKTKKKNIFDITVHKL
jgi:hypothetical protein